MAYTRARQYQFSVQTQERALGRQNLKCAICGDSFLENAPGGTAQHIVPIQAASRFEVEPDFIASMDNCVIVCDNCDSHSSNGLNGNGHVHSTTSYPHFGHQTKMKALVWSIKINRVWNRVREEYKSQHAEV